MSSIIVRNLNNKIIPNNPSINLLNNISISNTKIDTICGGHAICGRCRIKILESSKYLTPVNSREKARLKHFIDEGWRLACQTHSLKDVIIYIPEIGSDEAIIKV